MILGGKTRIIRPLYVNRPLKPRKIDLLKYFDTIFESQIYTNDGPLVRELEERITNYLGVKHCVLITNGTLALQMTLNALELKGEVIVPAFTFIGTANALKWQGLTPVFCDIDMSTYNISPGHCRELINSNTAAILGVHLWGRTCDIDTLSIMAKEYNIPLIFDAAHAFACGYKNRLLGNFGDAEIFSFHATKSFHTGEGGAITTNDGILAEKLREQRNFGFVDYYMTSTLGINAKMSEFHAAVGLVNLDDFNDSISKSRKNYLLYKELLGAFPEIILIHYNPPHNYHYIVVELSDMAPLNRDELVEVLISENILARKYFYPGCHRMQPYGSLNDFEELPNTDYLATRCMVLPGGSNLKEVEIRNICDVINDAFEYHEKIRKHLSTIW